MNKILRNISVTAILSATAAGLWLYAQDQSTFRVKVELVVLSFAVTDNKGKYVNGLKPSDLVIYEDDIRQKMATFTEGNRAPLQVLDNGETRPLRTTGSSAGDNGSGVVDLRSNATGTNVFVLFDTSNYMYRGFVYASDAIADFIRGLDRADSIAVYTYSRNLNRAVPLNRDRTTAIAGLRKAVAGDDSALYNCLLLTLRDAAKVPGRKVVIVFSNGPDNASMVAPDDVRAVAEDEGIPIYVISTSEVTKDPISSNIFKRISNNTGGKSYFAKTWQKQVEAFESIREDLGNSYTVTYYPQPNPNEGFRRIRVELTSEAVKKYKVRARPGYRPQRGI
ncbi:MAG: VWA domain-containing protein [Acidobacteriaceae bacterium]|nr:VWA domain-containing protein [Acidobacteriaceae bacterium]MBV9034618.1 VWA domain-containing protein [Acidobacteriaceae bacterium]MBV9225986.1 VWA domain-containing protein [Acidobacteriaceae bacterium]MBV9304972.1 VWA domain-containing protein [Acidobacteriaceae bacterium]MBV9680085.1 VWA domain-containing protein [Acidobacteriaceae bacterium]